MDGSSPTLIVSPVLREQNQSDALVRLRAMSVSHKRAQRLGALSAWCSVLLAAAGCAASFVTSLVGVVAIAGSVWAVVYSAVFSSWVDSAARRAAYVQELLDVRLFRLSWNAVLAGEEPLSHEVNALSRRFSGKEEEVRDYYEIPDLPYPYDVIACQLQNLGWGARIRRRFARAVIGAICVWGAAGLVVALSAHFDLGEALVRWYVPSLAALLLGVTTVRTQWSVAAERERVLSLVRGRIAAGGGEADLLRLARQVQDVIFLSRQTYTRVPSWFFRQYQESDRADFLAAMRELRDQVGR